MCNKFSCMEIAFQKGLQKNFIKEKEQIKDNQNIVCGFY